MPGRPCCAGQVSIADQHPVPCEGQLLVLRWVPCYLPPPQAAITFILGVTGKGWLGSSSFCHALHISEWRSGQSRALVPETRARCAPAHCRCSLTFPGQSLSSCDRPLPFPAPHSCLAMPLCCAVWGPGPIPPASRGPPWSVFLWAPRWPRGLRCSPRSLQMYSCWGGRELGPEGSFSLFFFFWSFSLEAFLKMMDIHCGKEATLSKWRQVGPIRSPFTHLAPHRGLGDPRTLGCGETSPMILEPLSGM